MKIVVFCEADQAPGLALIAQARRMSEQAAVIALHEGTDGRAFLRCGADQAFFLRDTKDDCTQGSCIAAIISRISPDIVLFPATVRGRFLSAWVAGKLETGLTADCTGLSLTTDGLLLQTRPAYGGNLTAEILCRERRPQMTSVRPGVYQTPELSDAPRESSAPAGTRETSIKTECEFTEDPGKAFTELSSGLQKAILISGRSLPGDASMQNAKIIVAGGKGIGGKQGFDLLFRLAEALGGAVGATRSAVDAGWIGYAHQIGQTGVTVRPELYLAFGISGMIQHVVGMRGAKVVMAVNQDRNAPIFRTADYGIVGCWRETAEYMLQTINERKGSL